MKDRIGIALGLLVTVLVVVSLAAYMMFAGKIGYGELAPAVIVMVLVVFSIYILWDRAKNASRGLPAKDERLRNINYKAGYYGFIAAIWSAVGVPLLVDIVFGHELEGHLITAAVVVVSGLVFATSYLYLARKGN
jgi:hypothetical protein